jgi:hypothetical protein
MMKYLIKIAALLSILFLFVYSCKDDNPVESSEEHFEAIGLFIISSGDTIVKYQGGEVTGEIEATVGDHTALLSILFISEDGDVGIPPGAEWALDWDIADTTVADVDYHEDELELYKFHIEGKKEGETTIKIIINHNDHKDFESKAIVIRVGPVMPGMIRQG